MKFFFDESGSFTPSPNPNALSVSVVVGVAISESVEAKFREDFDSFVKSLSDEERDDGEPKGRLISNKNRIRFCDLLDRYRKTGLLLAPVLVDMSIVPGSSGALSPKWLADHFRNLTTGVPSGKVKDEVLAVAQRVENLSEVQLQRIHTWTLAIQFTINEAVYWLSSEGNEHHWETLRFEVDVVDARNNSLEEAVFRQLVNVWISAYSRQHRFKIDPDIHDSEHPVISRYLVDDGLDFVRMLDGNIHFCDSKTSIGIQVADIASNIIFRAAHRPLNEEDALDIYAHLMDSCPYPPERGPGFSYVSSDQSDVPAVRMKYDHLFSVLEHRRMS